MSEDNNRPGGEISGYSRTDRSLPIALLRAREVVMRPIRDMLARSPVNEQKWRVLRVLEESGPLDQNHLAEAACLLPPSLTRILASMEAQGLVARGKDPHDARRAIISIARPGRAVLEAYAGESAAIFRALRARYGAEKLELLLDMLEELQREE